MDGSEKYFIKKIEILGLFDAAEPIVIELDRTMNCIYGANGSGKTTIINLLVSALSCDYKKLANIKFESLTVFICKENQKRSIRFFKVVKIPSEKPISAIKYQFPKSGDYGLSADGPNVLDATEIKAIIDKRISINYLPLHRFHDLDASENSREYEMLLRNYRGSMGGAENTELAILADPIRRMLLALERKFKDEYSKKQRSIRSDLENLKDKVLEKLLIDDELVAKVSETTLRKVDVSRDGYSAAKKKLDDIGLKLPHSKLEAHFAAMNRVSEELFSRRNHYMELRANPTADQTKRNHVYAEYSAALRIYRSLDPIHNRFMGIISDVERSTVYRIAALKVFKDFEDSVNTFLVNKRFEFTDTGEFKFICRGTTVKIEDLSSGEKHILALLGKVALSPDTAGVFIADEPELSLHLSWQRKLLPALHKISPHMQIIVATHAPAIIPSGAKKVDLDKLSYGTTTI